MKQVGKTLVIIIIIIFIIFIVYQGHNLIYERYERVFGVDDSESKNG